MNKQIVIAALLSASYAKVVKQNMLAQVNQDLDLSDIGPPVDGPQEDAPAFDLDGLDVPVKAEGEAPPLDVDAMVGDLTEDAGSERRRRVYLPPPPPPPPLP